jgi:hypothetical protein
MSGDPLVSQRVRDIQPGQVGTDRPALLAQPLRRRMVVRRPLRLALLPPALSFVVDFVGEAYPAPRAMQGPTAASATTYVPLCACTSAVVVSAARCHGRSQRAVVSPERRSARSGRRSGQQMSLRVSSVPMVYSLSVRALRRHCVAHREVGRSRRRPLTLFDVTPAGIVRTP